MHWMTIFDNLGIWVASFLTLAVFSFLYRDNPIYKIAEHIYVGIAAGYYLYQAFHGTILPNLFQHVLEGAHRIAAGDASGWDAQWRWGALVLGMLMLSRLVPKWSWISRWPMALIVGAFAALNLVGFAKANLIDQLNATFLPLYSTDKLPWLPFASVNGTWRLSEPGDASVFNHFVFVSGVICVLVYFLFSESQRGRFSKLQSLGMAFIMVTFGATYGSIVLARISLLIGRVQFLTGEAARADLYYPPICCAVVITVLLAFWRLKYYKPDGMSQHE